MTGYSVVEYKNGTAGYPREKTSSSEVDSGMPKNKSYSEIIKNMIDRDDNLTIGELSNRYCQCFLFILKNFLYSHTNLINSTI